MLGLHGFQEWAMIAGLYGSCVGGDGLDEAIELGDREGERVGAE
jgi:hypothetical protein